MIKILPGAASLFDRSGNDRGGSLLLKPEAFSHHSRAIRSRGDMDQEAYSKYKSRQGSWRPVVIILNTVWEVEGTGAVE